MSARGPGAKSPRCRAAWRPAPLSATHNIVPVMMGVMVIPDPVWVPVVGTVVCLVWVPVPLPPSPPYAMRSSAAVSIRMLCLRRASLLRLVSQPQVGALTCRRANRADGDTF